IGIAKNIFAAGASLLFRQNMTSGAILDSNQIKSGVQISRHSPFQKINNDLTGGSGLDIPRPHRSRWINDYQRQPARKKTLCFSLGKKFALLVRPDHVGKLYRGFFGSRHTISAISKRADAAGVDRQ